MAAQSHSFLGNLGLTEKPEKIYLVVNPVKARGEGAPFPENTTCVFPHKTNDEKMKDEEQQKMEEGSGSDRVRWSRAVSTATRSRSSSVTSGSSYSSGRRGNLRTRRRSYCSSGSSSRSRSRSPSRSRPRPRCHRAPARSRCCSGVRGGHSSPPRRYRARSRSYSPSHSPAWRHHRRRIPPRSRSRSPSRSAGRRAHGLAGRSRLRLTLSPERRSPPRSRSRSRSPDATSVHLSLQEKRQLLLIAKENAARALGVEQVALPSGVNAGLEVPEEEPAEFTERVRPGGSALRSLRENFSQAEAEEEVPCPKMSHRNKISFSINNSVAKPAASRSSSSQEKTATVRFDSATGRNPYGHWVPVKARLFPLSTFKRLPTKLR